MSAASAGGFAEDLRGFQTRFDAWLAAFVAERRAIAAARDGGLDEFLSGVQDYALRPGKRIRPFLVEAGYLAGGGARYDDVMPVAAAAEMLHVFALAHDDVMDRSDLRRGLPTAHRMWEAWHGKHGLRGDAAHFGVSAALLIGDLALALSDTLIDSARLDSERREAVRDVWNTMREEVIEGQFLDVVASSRPAPAPEQDIWSILSLKSGKYTLERPLHLGAAAAGADDSVFAAFTSFGIPLGRAFQIKDDILGLFGDEVATGKPVDSDIREGKSTLLISRAYETSDEAGRDLLRRVWGDDAASPADVEKVREIVTSTGARRYAEQTAERLVREALDALAAARIGADWRETLGGMAHFILTRAS